MRLRKIFAAALLLLSVGNAMAQMPPIPVDKNVKIGHLENGLTYYIRHNAFPEHVASFYIAQKVGSINENDDQRGLAHLLEHLAFNGTEHFKGNSLQDYLQSIGVEYGRNLNAYTSIDKTVYYFTDVPTTRTSAVDSCMLILKDWSNGISLTKEAINDERDVVHNEYRLRMVGQQLMLERNLPKLYQGEKYGYRMPIGLMSVVDGCDPETLRAYYRKWYRPDNQAIIIVGDIDVDHVEAQIKKLFSGIKVPKNAAKVVPVPVADNDTAIYVIDKNKEQKFDMINIMMKTDAYPDSLKGNMAYLVMGYLRSVVGSMFDARLAEQTREADCPFLQGSAGIGSYLISGTKDAFSISGVAKPGKVKEAYAAFLREAKRVRDFGFTATEYARAKENFMSGMETMYENRNKMKNEQFTTQYVDHFTDNEPIPSLEDEYKIYQMIVPSFTVEHINDAMKNLISETDTNFVSMVLMKEAEGVSYPTEQELAAIVKQVRGEKLEAYVDNVKQEPLMASAPKAGSIKKVVENKVLGFKKLTLSNGAKVVLKKTDYKDNEIRVAGSANVGYSAFQNDPVNAANASTVWEVSGLAGFTGNDLQKMLAGKQCSVGLTMSPFRHGIAGTSTPKDLETMMQLLYLSMTNLTKDEKAFENLKNTYVTVLSNKSNNPNMVYQDSIQSTLYLGNKLALLPNAEDIQNINYDRVLDMQKQLYGNAKDFTFYFVGNYDEKVLLPLIEQYIASLPNKGMKLKNQKIPYAKGEVKNIFTKAMENPQSQAREMWFVKLPAYTQKTAVLADISARLLEMKYLRSIREELSAAYSTGASCGLIFDYDGKLALTINGTAQLNPDKVDAAVPCFFKGMEETIAAPDANDLQKVKEILLKQAGVDEKTNSYWMQVLSMYDLRKVDTHTNYREMVKSVTAQQISDFLKNVVLKSGNHFEVIMKAEKNK
ncbi:insulinase family protein [Segatella copri]|uniref:M16 family metallopeptidase n=1 Tax=Segatella copri TaxID=165179 RepID=UPI001C47FE4D|nr:M16 family metallopeptidase [Segatella copri]WOZ85420.1 insulinase family protein [Segatella copri]